MTLKRILDSRNEIEDILSQRTVDQERARSAYDKLVGELGANAAYILFGLAAATEVSKTSRSADPLHERAEAFLRELSITPNRGS